MYLLFSYFSIFTLALTSPSLITFLDQMISLPVLHETVKRPSLTSRSLPDAASQITVPSSIQISQFGTILIALCILLFFNLNILSLPLSISTFTVMQFSHSVLDQDALLKNFYNYILKYIIFNNTFNTRII